MLSTTPTFLSDSSPPHNRSHHLDGQCLSPEGHELVGHGVDGAREFRLARVCARVCYGRVFLLICVVVQPAWHIDERGECKLSARNVCVQDMSRFMVECS